MKLLLLGATGRVGREILRRALRDGHQVTALVRTPDKLSEAQNGLTVLQGDVCRQEDVERAMRGADAVISALGTDGGTTLTVSTPVILAAMQKAGIRRLITIGTAGILQSRVDPSLLRYQSSESKRKSTRAAEEHEAAYRLIASSDLDWTIVCPTYLPDGEAIGDYRVERDVLPLDGKKISVGDTAEFAYQQLTREEFLRTRVGITY